MSNTRIIWTDNERALLVNTLASYLKANGQTVADVIRPGWFAFYMQQAQVFLAEDRRRRIFGPGVLPWLLPELRSAMGEAVTPVGTVADYVRENLEEVLRVLSETYVVVLKTECVTRQVTRGHTTKQKLLRVVIVGCLPAQAAELSAEYGKDFDLRFHNSDNLNEATVLVANCDYAIGLTSFMSHAVDGKLRARLKSRYFRVIGALAGVKRQLDDLKTIGVAVK